MHEPQLESLTKALAVGGNQPEAGFASLCEYTHALIGHKLFTLMKIFAPLFWRRV